MPIVQNQGLRIHHEVHGSGPPVVLLHGATVSFQFNYANLGWIELLNAAGFQVVGIDFRGHGHSDKPHAVASYGTARLASDVFAVLDHLRIPRASLVAYSLGTAVAVHLMQASPGRIDRAALIATGDGLVGHPPHTFASVIPPLALVLGRAEYPRDLPRHLAAYWNFVAAAGGDTSALLALCQAEYPHVPEEEAGSISIPTLVVSGEHDKVLGRGPRLAGALGRGEYLEVEGADHFSLAADSQVKAAVAGFLRRGDR
jgi:pimeloyl-ACP methyl ester carboxylesterase